MAEDAPSYEESLTELETILQAIEGEDLPIDALAPKVERAAELLELCRGVLADTETRVTKAIDALRGDATPEES
jgi:exodeoxyribonuclease VII small subunit